MELRRDSYFDAFDSLTWAGWYAPWLASGALALLGGCALWFKFRMFRVPLVVLSWIQVAYGIAYIFFGPEGQTLYTAIAPLLVVALSLWTIHNISRWLMLASA